MYECIFPGKSCFLCIFWLPTLSCVCEVLCGIVLRKKKEPHHFTHQAKFTVGSQHIKNKNVLPNMETHVQVF